MALIRTNGQSGGLSLNKGDFVAGSGAVDMAKNTYTSGTAFLTDSDTFGASAAVSPRTNSCDITINVGSGKKVSMVGLKNGNTVKSVANTTVSSTLTESFTGCDLIVIGVYGGAGSVNITATDN